MNKQMKRIFVLGYFIIINFNLLAQTTYYPSGKIDEIIDPVTNIHTSYYEDGTKKSQYIFIKSTGIEGEFFSYHPNGKIENRYTYKNGKREGIHTSYYDDGKLRSVYKFKNNEPDGDYFGFNWSGNISSNGTYKNGKKIGIHYFYNNYGIVTETQVYPIDMPIETTAKVQSKTSTIPKNTPKAITPTTPIAQRKNKPIRVDAFDFMDYPKKYIGKTVTLTVFYSSDNEKVINQPESRENTSEMYYDNLCQCLKPKDRYSKVGTHAVHWKKFIEVNSVASITINVPKSFFMDNKIPQNFGKGHLDIDIDVYSGESRKSPEKGEYSESLSSENYELVNIRRHRY